MICVRFAQAPTGNLTMSNARVALANNLFARRGNGQMLLRLDDLDRERARPGAADQVHGDQIMQDLQWLGIGWDTVFRQSERRELYQDTFERLKRDQFIYPCFESEEELKAKQEFRRKRNQPLIYDRAMLSLTTQQRANAEAGGKRPHWRFKLSGRTLQWNDLIAGPQRAVLASVSDPILVRADGSPTPTLASVVDDIAYGTTHIIRADDSAGNTAVQIELFEVLRGPKNPLKFGHLPSLEDSGKPAAGTRKTGNLTLRALRNDGVEPWAIIACITGQSAQDGDRMPLEELAQQSQLADIAAAQFDVTQILAANRLVLRGLDFAAVADRLPGGATEAFWLAVRAHLDLLKEARGWWDVVAGTIVPPVIEGEKDLLLKAGSLLPREPWDALVWATWIAELERSTGRGEAALTAPLRVALTGEDNGPDLADLLPLIGRPRAATRLEIAAS